MRNINYKAIFGQNLKRLRINAGLTQESLSEKINVSAQHLSYVESGKRAASFDLIVDLAFVLGVSPADLFAEKKHLIGKTDKSSGRIKEILSRMSKNELDRALKIISLSLPEKNQR